MLAGVSHAESKLPFVRGVNLSSWFEIWSPGHPNYRAYDKNDFVNLKAMGVELVRIPLHFENLSSGSPEYKIHPLTYKFLDMACDWAEELGLYIVIDNHSYNGKFRPSPKDLERHLKSVWTQLAEHYKDRSDKVIYEILNEPNGISQADWQRIQGKTISLIRSIDSRHSIVVTGADWSGISGMNALKKYDDDNLIYTFHFYSPMLFTHQGADWSNECFKKAAKVPFPYEKSRMPRVETKNSYDASLVSNYSKDGTEDAIRKEIQQAVEFSRKNNVPLWCGEMGVYDKTAPEDDRAKWYAIVSSIFEENGIPFTVWDYRGSFGFFEKGKGREYPYDLDERITRALGLKVPAAAGKKSAEKKIAFPLVIQDDFPGMNFSLWADKGFNLACEADPAEGYFSIEGKNVGRYSCVRWTFRNQVDLSTSGLNDVYLHLNVKFTKKDQQLDLRFVNSEGERQLPWRMDWKIRAKDYVLNEWAVLEIPLGSFVDSGAWSTTQNKFFEPNGEFDWSKVEAFLVTSEDADIKGSVFLDDIRIIRK